MLVVMVLIILSHIEKRELETRVPQCSEQIIINSITFYKNKTDGDIENVNPKTQQLFLFWSFKEHSRFSLSITLFAASSISLTSSNWDRHDVNHLDLEIE